jgi:hypothetical protein
LGQVVSSSTGASVTWGFKRQSSLRSVGPTIVNVAVTVGPNSNST